LLKLLHFVLDYPVEQSNDHDAMKKSEIEIGATYAAKVSGKLTCVRIVNDSPYGGWNAVNTATKHEVRIKTAARLRRRVDTDRLSQIRHLRSAGASYEAARAVVVREEQTLRDVAADIRSRTETSSISQ
jgi:hypothetical protein